MIDKSELTIFVQVLGVTLRYTAWIDDQVIHSLNACHATLPALKNLTEQRTTNGRQTRATGRSSEVKTAAFQGCLTFHRTNSQPKKH